MALGVVAHVDEELSGVVRHADAVEQEACGRPLLRDHGILLVPAAICVPDRVRAAVGDPGQERLRGERAVDAAPRREAISGDSAHSSWRSLSPYRYPFPSTVGQVG